MALSPPVCAQTAPLPIAEEYTVRRWGVEDGVPEGMVTAVTQFPDGFIWLTTLRHVVRFDGVEFVTLPQEDYPKEKPKRFNSLLCDRSGCVWVSGEDGVMRYDGHAWAALPLLGEVALPSEKNKTVDTPDGALEQSQRLAFFWVREGNDGTVWAASNAGMFRFDGQALRLVPPEGAAVAGRYSSAAMDTHGSLWLAGEDGLVAFDGEKYTQHRFPEEEGKGRLFQVFAGFGDTLWGKRVDGKLFRRVKGAWNEVPPPGLRMAALLERSEETWLGTVEGLYRWRQNMWHVLTETRMEKAQDIRCLSVTSEGSLWAGTGNGLFQLKPRTIRMFGVGGSGQSAAVTALLPSDNQSFWAGVGERGLWAGPVASLHPLFPVHPVLEQCEVSALCDAGDGQLWVGTRGSHLWKIATNGIARQFRSSVDYASRDITTLLKDRAGRLWVGTREGLLSPDAAGWLARTDGSPEDAVLALCDDNAGRLWVGTQSSGLWSRSDTNVWRVLRQTDGLPSDTIRALQRDAEGRLWIATPKGLACLDVGERKADDRPLTSDLRPLITCFTRAQGLPDDDIRQLLEDGQGNLWLGTKRTLLRISKRDLADVASGRRAVLTPRAFGSGDGLAGELTGGDHSGPLAVRTEDGKLWFATRQGIAMLDPSLLSGEDEAVQVYVEGVSVGGEGGGGEVLKLCFSQHCWPRAAGFESSKVLKCKIPEVLKFESSKVSKSGSAELSANAGQVARPLILPAGSRDVSVQFNSPCYASPEQVLFRTYLEGYDVEWSQPSAARSRLFSSLPPGGFKFRVMASSSSGGWSEAKEGVRFIVKPFFWQTGWFITLAGALALGLTALGSGLLVRMRAKRRLAREMALAWERARIARDLHDDIGAGLSQVAMMTDLALADAERPAEIRTHLDGMFRLANTLVESLDEIVWALNPKQDKLENVVSFLIETAQQLCAAADIAFRFAVPSQLPELILIGSVRHHLCLAVKEALHNALKHAGAHVVRLHVEVDARLLRIEVIDDGSGFDPVATAGLVTGGEGLSNMYKRMEEVGGRCHLTSACSEGSRVSFEVTVEEPRRSRRWIRR